MKAPAVVSIFLGLEISECRGILRSGPFRVRPIFQQVAPEIMFELAKSVFLERACSLRAGEREDPPA